MPVKRQKLVMVGNGMAGVRTLEELLKIAPELYDITVFGAEPHPNYNRILLSPVLAGEQSLDEIVLNSWDWYKDKHITLHAGKKVVAVDRIKRVVRAADGTEEHYDRLLMCTGSTPFILPVPGKDLEGVIAYRDIADTNAMIEASARFKKAVVIGGGLLGLEAANGLMRHGMEVTVVHVMPWLMERQLDDVAGKLLQKSLEDRGLKFLLGAQTQELTGNAEGRGRRPDQGALDCLHQPGPVHARPGHRAPGAGTRRSGRCARSICHHRNLQLRRPVVADHHLGRKDGHGDQQRAPHQPGAASSQAARRGPPRLGHRG